MNGLDAHRCEFEADNSGLTAHLRDVHGIASPFDEVPPDAGGWERLDGLHVLAHEAEQMTLPELRAAHVVLREAVASARRHAERLRADRRRVVVGIIGQDASPEIAERYLNAPVMRLPWDEPWGTGSNKA